MKKPKDLPAGQVAAEIGLMTVTIIGDLVDELMPPGDPRRVAFIGRLRVAAEQLSAEGVVSHGSLMELLAKYLTTRH